MNDLFAINVQAAIQRDGRWLVIERSAGLTHAGGTVESTDATEGVLEDCARREVFEEVGVTLTADLHYVASTRFFSAKGRWVVNVVFAARHEPGCGEPRVAAPDEVAWTGWCRTDELLADPRSPSWFIESIHAAERCLATLPKEPADER